MREKQKKEKDKTKKEELYRQEREMDPKEIFTPASFNVADFLDKFAEDFNGNNMREQIEEASDTFKLVKNLEIETSGK